jgi:hypothetical protein
MTALLPPMPTQVMNGERGTESKRLKNEAPCWQRMVVVVCSGVPGPAETGVAAESG